MERKYEKSILQRYPAQTMVVAAFVLGIAGLIFMLTVAGAIVGLPLLAIAAILGLLGAHKYRSEKSI